MNFSTYKRLVLFLFFLLPLSKTAFAQIPDGNPNCEVGDGVNVSLNDSAAIYLGGYGTSQPHVRIPVISKIDTLGNVIWKYVSNRNLHGEVVSAYREGASLYVVCKYDSVKLANYTYKIILEVSKFNTLTGQRTWRRTLPVLPMFSPNSGNKLHYTVVTLQQRNANELLLLHNVEGDNDLINHFRTLNKTTGIITSTITGSRRMIDYKLDSTFTYGYGVGTDTVYKVPAANPNGLVWKTKINNGKTDARVFLDRGRVHILTSWITSWYDRQAYYIGLSQSNGTQAWATLGGCYDVFVNQYEVQGDHVYVGWKSSSVGGGYYSVQAEKYNLLNGTKVWTSFHALTNSSGSYATNHIMKLGNRIYLTGEASEEVYYSNRRHYWFNYVLNEAGAEIYFNKTSLDSLDERFTRGLKTHALNNKAYHLGMYQDRAQPNIYNQHVEYPKTLVGLVHLNGAGTQTYRKIIPLGAQTIIDPGVKTVVCPGDTLWLSNKNFPAAGSAGQWFINNQPYSSAADTFALLTAHASVKFTFNNGFCARTFTYPVVIAPANNLTVSPDVTINYGSSTTISAAGPPTYFWYPNVAISSQTNRIVTVSPPKTTMYYVTGTTFYGCTKTDSVLVTVLNSPLGMDEETLSETNLKIYPVPSPGVLNLDLATKQPARVAVYNALGQCVLRKEIPANQSKPLQLDLTKEARGIYSVQVVSGSRSVVRKVILE